MELADGRSALRFAVSGITAIAEALPDAHRETILVGESDHIHEVAQTVPESWSRVELEAGGTVADLFDVLASIRAAGDDTFVITWLDQPFPDCELTTRMVDRHEQWWCDYTFADGYPAGLAPELLRADVLPALRQISTVTPVTRDFLFATIQKDINAFDIETEVSETDYLPLRVILAADSRRNYLACRQIAASRPETREALLTAVETNAEIQRTVPAYIQVQVSTKSAQTVSYEPAVDTTGSVGFLSAERFDRILEELVPFAPGATIALGYLGEPSFNPEITAIVENARNAGFPVLVETSGIGWSAAAVEAIGVLLSSAASPSVPPVSVIVYLDANDRELYRRLRGDGYDEAHDFAQRMCEIAPSRTWIQAVRLPESEEHLREFYRYWEDRSAGVIIQKYNNVAGLLPDRRVADLAPLHRNACRHLQRDLVIRMNGDVPICFQDIFCKLGRGNIFREGIESIWSRGLLDYRNHLAGTRPLFCEKCDEYYTVNA